MGHQTQVLILSRITPRRSLIKSMTICQMMKHVQFIMNTQTMKCVLAAMQMVPTLAYLLYGSMHTTAMMAPIILAIRELRVQNHLVYANVLLVFIEHNVSQQSC